MSKLVNIADAVLTRLNAATFTSSFTAEKRLFPRFEMEGIDSLSVDVYGASEEWERETRSGVYTRAYDVAVVVDSPVQQSATLPNLNSSIESLIDLLEEIKNDLAGRTMDGCPLIEIAQDEPFDSQFFHEFGFFHSVLIFKYKAIQ